MDKIEVVVKEAMGREIVLSGGDASFTFFGNTGHCIAGGY